MSDERPVVEVADARSFETLLETLEGARRVGVDTEANSFHAYRERVCLVQLSTTDTDYVVDPLAVDLRPLGALFADPEREVIFHAAEYDVRSLRRDYGFEFAALFDTQAAAMVLGSGQVGYAALVEAHFGIKLPKAHQRSDWGRRPLSREQVAYAAADVRWLIPLRDLLAEALDEARRRREADAQFARLAGLEPVHRVFDPEAYRRIKGYRDLDDVGRSVVRSLFLAREARAERLDLPPFKVLQNEALLGLARTRPTRVEDLGKVRGVSRITARKWGREILAAIREGEAAPEAPPRKPAPKARMDPEVEARYEALRAWRKRKADEKGVAVQVVATGATLKALARAHPKTLEALAALPEVDAYRVETYGEELLAVLGHPAPRR